MYYVSIAPSSPLPATRLVPAITYPTSASRSGSSDSPQPRTCTSCTSGPSEKKRNNTTTSLHLCDTSHQILLANDLDSGASDRPLHARCPLTINPDLSRQTTKMSKRVPLAQGLPNHAGSVMRSTPVPQRRRRQKAPSSLVPQGTPRITAQLCGNCPCPSLCLSVSLALCPLHPPSSPVVVSLARLFLWLAPPAFLALAC